uniref:MPN domain-containing protein n=1 Tax=Kalanchoe fedtschenkoi TaxID=63787 RepID=A0A7N0U2V8_KALFE
MAAGESRYELGQDAYIKLLLHTLRHPTSAVNSVLIGRLNDSNVVEIADAVPLFHTVTSISLLPSLEIALLLIEEYYANKGLSVVGYFHANERAEDVELTGAAKNIGDQIYKYLPQAVILLLDSRKLEFLTKGKDRSPILQLYTRDSSRNWKLSETDGKSRLTLKEPSANAVLLDYISTKKWEQIVDFDDHLDDISKDWLNPGLFQ